MKYYKFAFLIMWHHSLIFSNYPKLLFSLTVVLSTQLHNVTITIQNTICYEDSKAIPINFEKKPLYSIQVQLFYQQTKILSYCEICHYRINKQNSRILFHLNQTLTLQLRCLES